MIRKIFCVVLAFGDRVLCLVCLVCMFVIIARFVFNFFSGESFSANTQTKRFNIERQYFCII